MVAACVAGFIGRSRIDLCLFGCWDLSGRLVEISPAGTLFTDQQDELGSAARGSAYGNRLQRVGQRAEHWLCSREAPFPAMGSRRSVTKPASIGDTLAITHKSIGQGIAIGRQSFSDPSSLIGRQDAQPIRESLIGAVRWSGQSVVKIGKSSDFFDVVHFANRIVNAGTAQVRSGCMNHCLLRCERDEIAGHHAVSTQGVVDYRYRSRPRVITPLKSQPISCTMQHRTGRSLGLGVSGIDPKVVGSKSGRGY